MTRDDLLAEAWSWARTPFVWQASLKGVGADCKGFVWGVARALGLPEAQSAFASIADYRRRVPVETLKEGLRATFAPGSCARGDLLLLRYRGRDQHLAFHAGDVILHTYPEGPKCVIQSPLPAAFDLWPLVSAWRFASLEA